MKKILFVCHGNICRSPMAEFVLKDMVKKRGLEGRYEIASAGRRSETPSIPPPGESWRSMESSARGIRPGR